MAKLNWPPEKTFNYIFREKEELTMEIPLLVDNDKEIKKSNETAEKDRG